MNKEELDIWLKHFADKQTGYQMFDENGTRREINFFIVFRYLKELQQKANQLESTLNEVKEYIYNHELVHERVYVLKGEDILEILNKVGGSNE